ncbi:MAG: glycosyltransferase family 61 protein [Caulobacterales bacterium]|nr:glycosyltransferase family 61 protein [Caulobacterales bacterium]
MPAARLILPFVSEAAYARAQGLARRELFSAERVEMGPPVVLPASEAAFHGRAPLAYDFPAVTVTTLREVVVRGKSNLLTTPEAIVRHGLIVHATDITPEEYYTRLTISEDGVSAAWGGGDPFAVGYLPEAAAFTDGSSANYAHWMTEVLPRIAAYLRAVGPGVAPLIVDADLHPNLMRSIGLVAGRDVEIVRLAVDQAVRVGVLHNVSPTGYGAFKLRPQPREAIVDGLFASAALRASVAALRSGAGGEDEGGERPKLFLLRRNTVVRHLVNEPEIEAALTARGFQVVETDRLSLEAQVALFSRARMVAGTTGAAITNLVFCPPDCPVVVVMKHRSPGYWYWRRLAAAAGAGTIVHVSAEPAPGEDAFDPNSPDRNLQVDLRHVLDGLDAAEALAG